MWSNSGTVADAGVVLVGDHATGSLASDATASIVNQTGAVFDLTADGDGVYDNAGYLDGVNYLVGSSTFLNDGLLDKTAGTGTSVIQSALTNASSGTVLASSGTLALYNGGTLAGIVTTAAGSELEFNGGAFSLTGSLVNGGTLAVSSGTVGFAASAVTVANIVDLATGTVDVASGQTLTLAGAVDWTQTDFVGPGTLQTTGTTTINAINGASALIDGGLSWINSGTVFNSAAITDGEGLRSSTLPNAVTNQAGGIYDFTAGASQFSVFYNFTGTAPTVFTNAGLLEATAGGAIIDFLAALNSTGTVLASAGRLDLDNGGTLGGMVTTAAGSELEFNGGAFSLTGSLVNGGTLAVSSGTVGFAASAVTVANIVDLATGTVDVASGQTLTLAGAVDWTQTDFVGPGTLQTTGTTTINAINGASALIDGGLSWINSGTVFNSAAITDGEGLRSSTLPNAVTNQAGGIYDFTAGASQFSVFYNFTGTAPTVFTNAGLLEATAGGAIIDFLAALNSTGTVLASAGRLDLDNGGTLGGTIGGTGAGLLLLDSGAGFVAANTLAILDAGAANDLRIVNEGALTDTGVIADAGNLGLGNGSGTSELIIAVGASFDFTTDDGNIIDGGGSALNNSGTIAKTGGPGASQINVSLINSGIVVADSGTLRLAAAVTGTGALVVGSGATLELAAAMAQGVTFEPGVLQGGTLVGGTLKIDTAASYTGTIDVGAADTLDVADLIVSSASIINGTLVADINGVGTQKYALAGSGVGDTLKITNDGGTGTDLIFYRYAQATTIPGAAFGDLHTGATANVSLGVTNTQPADAYSEALDGSVGAATGDITASGSFTGLTAQATDATDLQVTLNTTTDGAKTGTAVVSLTSDGTGVDGNGLTPLPSQTISATGTVFNYATASVIAPNPINFGEHHAGDPLRQTLSIGNLGTADGFSESLDAEIASTTGAATGSGSIAAIAAGANASLTIGLSSTTPGIQSGTAVIALTSDGTNIDTLGTTALSAQTIAVAGTLYNYATASTAAPIPVNFGIVHVGDTVSRTLSIANDATADGFSEGLDASIGNASAGVIANGAFNGLTAAATDSTDLTVGLNTASAGTISGTATIAPVSDGSGIDTLGTTPLAAQTVTVEAVVYNYATAAIEEISGPGTLTQAGGAYTLALGTIDLDTAAPEIDLGIANAASGPADLLSGTFAASLAAGFTTTLTNFSNLVAGGVAGGEDISLATTQVGAFTDTITLFGTGTNASGYSGMFDSGNAHRHRHGHPARQDPGLDRRHRHKLRKPAQLGRRHPGPGPGHVGARRHGHNGVQRRRRGHRGHRHCRGLVVRGQWRLASVEWRRSHHGRQCDRRNDPGRGCADQQRCEPRRDRSRQCHHRQHIVRHRFLGRCRWRRLNLAGRRIAGRRQRGLRRLAGQRRSEGHGGLAGRSQQRPGRGADQPFRPGERTFGEQRRDRGG